MLWKIEWSRFTHIVHLHSLSYALKERQKWAPLKLQLISCCFCFLSSYLSISFFLGCLFVCFHINPNIGAHFLECTNNVASKPKFDAVGILRIFAAAQNSFISRVQLRWKNAPLMEFRKSDYAFLMYFDCTGWLILWSFCEAVLVILYVDVHFKCHGVLYLN